MENEVDRASIERFLLAGNCQFKIYQEETSNSPAKSKLYKLKAKGDGFYVFTQENGGKAMTYHGFLVRKSQSWYYYPNKKLIGTSKYNNENMRGLLWVLNHLGKLPKIVHILHTGKCSRCGRTLTDQESIRYGMGPECRRKSKL